MILHYTQNYVLNHNDDELHRKKYGYFFEKKKIVAKQQSNFKSLIFLEY